MLALRASIRFAQDDRAFYASLLPFAAVFRDVHDLVLKNKKIGSALARQPHHIFIVVLDPSRHGLAIHELHAYRLLLFPEGLEESGLFEGFLRRWSPAPLGSIGISRRAKRHAGIVHG